MKVEAHLLRYGRVISNSALKRRNDGRFSSNRVCFRNGWCNSISSSGKINKDFETKGNSRSGLQRRVMHCSKTPSDCRVEISRYYANSFIRSVIVNATMWGLIFWFFLSLFYEK